jgi:hypothetical protein
MSAIERCRTAALGGHVARCEDCSHTVIAYNSCRNRHCPKCQGAAATEWLAAREADLLPVAYFHVVFTLPAAIADIAYQNKGRHLRHPVHGLGRDHDRHRGRSQASRSPHRHHLGTSHLGLGDDAPSPCAHDRAGRRHLARRQAMGLMQVELFPARAGSLAPDPRIVCAKQFQWFAPRQAISRSVGNSSIALQWTLFHRCSRLRRTVINLDLQHWKVRQQFCCRLLGSIFFRKLGFEMPVDDNRVSVYRRDVSPLYISRLLFFDAQSWLFHVSYFCAV